MTSLAFFNDIKRTVRARRLETEGVTTIFGDAKLDLSQAPLDPGEHTLRLIAGFGDIKLRIPEHIGIEFDAMIIFGEVEIETLATGDEEKPGNSWVSENFEQAEIRVRIQIQSWFGDVELIRVQSGNNTLPRSTPMISQQDLRDSHHSYEGETSRLPRE